MTRIKIVVFLLIQPRLRLDTITYFLLSLISQVPGLFEGDEFAALMTQCKEGAQREGLMLDSNDELYKW